jgi:hypothetical protein
MNTALKVGMLVSVMRMTSVPASLNLPFKSLS